MGFFEGISAFLAYSLPYTLLYIVMAFLAPKFKERFPDGKAACDWIRGANDVSWLASVPASIFALMLLRDQVKHTGVFPPEVFDREEIEIFYSGIREWGIRVIKQSRSAVV